MLHCVYISARSHVVQQPRLVVNKFIYAKTLLLTRQMYTRNSQELPLPICFNDNVMNEKKREKKKNEARFQFFSRTKIRHLDR